MLQAQRSPITEEEAARIKSWLMSGAAIRLRELVLAEVAAQQVKAVQAMSDLKAFPNQQADIDAAVERIATLRSFLEVLSDFTKNPSQLAGTEIKVSSAQL